MQPKFDRPQLPAEVSHPLPLHIDDSVVGVHRNSVSDTVVDEHALIGVGDIAVLALTSRPSPPGIPYARPHRSDTIGPPATPPAAVLSAPLACSPLRASHQPCHPRPAQGPVSAELTGDPPGEPALPPRDPARSPAAPSPGTPNPGVPPPPNPPPAADNAGDNSPESCPPICDGSCPACDSNCPMLDAAIDGADIIGPIIPWADCSAWDGSCPPGEAGVPAPAGAPEAVPDCPACAPWAPWLATAPTPEVTAPCRRSARGPSLGRAAERHPHCSPSDMRSCTRGAAAAGCRPAAPAAEPAPHQRGNGGQIAHHCRRSEPRIRRTQSAQQSGHSVNDVCRLQSGFSYTISNDRGHRDGGCQPTRTH